MIEGVGVGSFVTFRNFLIFVLTKSKSIYLFLRQIVLHSKNHIKHFVLKCPVDFISNLETVFRKGRLAGSATCPKTPPVCHRSSFGL